MKDLISNTLGIWYKRAIAHLWYDYIIFFYFVIIVFVSEFISAPPTSEIKKMKKRSGQVAVITGGPRGLALGLLKRLVQLDYTIIMGVKSIENSEKRLAAFAEKNRELCFENVKFLKMNLSSLQSVRVFAANVLQETSRIDLLLCNAAIMKAPYEITVDGFESQFQVNYLSHFLLAHLLLDRLKSTAVMKRSPCQIICTSSVACKVVKFNINELEKPLVYTPIKFYFRSKLYSAMSMLYLEELLKKENAQVHCYAVHPGMVPTDMWYTGVSHFMGAVGQLLKNRFRTVETGADTILWPIMSPKYLHQGGLYMESGAVAGITDEVRNKNNQALLYAKSLQLIETKKNK